MLYVCLFATLVIGIFAIGSAYAQTSFAPLVAKVMPSVVSISVQQTEAEDAPEVVNNLLFGLPENRFGLGAGFIVDTEGYIATNRHVIEQAGAIVVTTADKKEYPATLTGYDVQTDLALLKIEPETELQAIKFGNSDEVAVGDWVLAVGNPFGLGSSVSAGIISAKSRDIGNGFYDDYLQTDAAINQGNSGGPLFDMSGNLVGINSAIFSTTGNNSGVGFALPSNQAEWIIRQLKNNGTVKRSWLGVSVKASQLPDGTAGVAIVSLQDESLAQKNKLQAGDIITAVNAKPVILLNRFIYEIAQMPVNSTLTLTVWRGGKFESLEAVTALMPDVKRPNTPVKPEAAELADGTYNQLGIMFNGLKVVSVKAGSDAAQKGVKAGDVLLKIGGIPVYVADEIDRQLADAELSGKSLRLDFNDPRTDEEYFVECAVVPEHE